MRRIYNLESREEGQVLTMSSYLEDEFGEVVLTTQAHLDGPAILQSASASCSLPMDVRLQEMYHFLSILKLFDPHFNTLTDVQKVVSTPPSSFPQ